jgi:hypothetical protein
MSKLSQQELWEKIQNFNFDDQNSSYPFSKKLASENNWSVSFTQKAIAEYRKFIFLCCISPGGASPSDIVDKVWHLHLTYTKNYWEDFCKNTLQKDIHHHPSKGGTEEKAKHENWYNETLLFYEAIFKSKPPTDIWPPAYEQEEIIEDIYDKSVIKKAILIFLSAVFLVVVTGNIYHSAGPDFLKFYMLTAIGGFIAIAYTQDNKKARLQEIVFANMPKKSGLYQITQYIHGPHRCYQTALIDLLKRGIIDTSGSKYEIVDLPTSVNQTESNPLLLQLTHHFKNGNKFSYLDGYNINDWNLATHPAFEKFIRLSKKVDYAKLVIPGIVLLIGFIRILQGIANEKPIEYLAIMMLVFSVFSLIILQLNSYTHKIKSIVQDLWNMENQEGKSDDVLNNFSVLGMAAIAGFAEYAFLTNDFSFYEPQNKKWNGSEYTASSSCGSGDGGGCGGGCGGCGG